MADIITDYCGRYAPSPTGPLHLGSLLAAMASYLDARHQQGQWRLRMEDLDPPREVPGAADAILRSLDTYGFTWDGPVAYQSQRLDAYQAALETLQQQGWSYPCCCSRKDILQAAPQQGIDGPVYPGTCRAGIRGATARAWRVRTEEREIGFQDRVQGWQSQNLARDVGDFPLLRADGYFAYQLAVVVDDSWQAINQIVRGSDLLDSTPRQIYLQQRLGLTTPGYLHIPVAQNALGEKLSKQTRASPIPEKCSVSLLIRCLRFLGQQIPADFQDAKLTEFWQWSIAHWDINRIPRRKGMPAP